METPRYKCLDVSFFALYRTESKNSGSFPKEGVLMLENHRLYNYVCGYIKPRINIKGEAKYEKYET